LLEQELELAPKKVRDLAIGIDNKNAEVIIETDSAVELAIKYISEKVVGQTSYSDCLHIALATSNRADLLISWNFKHIVNMNRIRGYNSINIKNGYSQLEIRSPRDLMDYNTE
jgi:hypothetical protein